MQSDIQEARTHPIDTHKTRRARSTRPAGGHHGLHASRRQPGAHLHHNNGHNLDQPLLARYLAGLA
ncbi:hypothetical protein [Streptomyces sp. rh34]|uniref:hypothetical protein n=1 Tax=Streptomyces sp. rh34 TaxID=2034272 RepID=UPI0015CF2FA2|nr:hypothetical protein [Streptomyces sp. rh34]